jgi:hypothetical protein
MPPVINYAPGSARPGTDPFQVQEMQAAHAPEAYNLASQMTAPAAAAGAGAVNPMWEKLFGENAEAMVGQENPGMPDEEYNAGLDQIMKMIQGERMNAAGAMATAGGGSIDPAAWANISNRFGSSVGSAAADLAARRSAANFQARLGTGQMLAPLVSQGYQRIGQQADQTAALAGNIMSSGTYRINTGAGSSPGVFTGNPATSTLYNGGGASMIPLAQRR